MATPIVNFGLVTVSGAYNASATSVTLQTGHGSKLPATTGGARYPLTWWDATTYAHPADDPFREIVLVTNRSGDVLTVIRGQEGTTGNLKNTAGVTYRMSLGITKSMFEDLRVLRSTHQGLVLQTDRDAGDAASKVELTTCDAIVMDDGTVIRNDNGEWTGKTASLALTGVGGIDAGTEEVGTWYEVYAVAKEDGTCGVMLHKSPLWAINTSYGSGEDASQAVRSAVTNAWVGQGFTLSDSGAVVFAEAKLRRVGSPTGSLVCAVYSNNAGVPGSVLATAHIVDVAKLQTVATTIRFTFPAPAPSLSAAPTVYHLVIGGTWTIDGSNYIEWRMDGSAGSYTPGTKTMWNNTTWVADADDDMMFAVGTERQVSPLALPTDYTKRCHLGWVRNDGNGNLVPSVQYGRTFRFDVLREEHCSIGMTDGTAQIKGLHDVVPPLELCRVRMGFGGTGTQAGLLAVGNLRALDIDSSGDTTGAQVVIQSGMTSTRPGGFQDVVIQRNACMVQGTAGGKIWISGFEW